MPKMNEREVTSKEASENILKTILTLHLKYGHAYVSDIAEQLNMNLTTTYTVIAQMVKNGLIMPLEGKQGRRAHKQSMTFTPQGEADAKKIFEKHQTIQKWLSQLGIPMDEADQEACIMEHGLTDCTMEILQNHVRMAMEMTGGREKNAASIMREISKRYEAENESGKTFSEQTIEALEDLGGLEGIERKGLLVERAGGEDKLSEILGFIEECGGIESARKILQDYRSYSGLSQKYGSPEEIGEVMAAAKKLGTPEDMKNLASAAKKYGGVKRFITFADELYGYWSGIFRTRKKKT